MDFKTFLLNVLICGIPFALTRVFLHRVWPFFAVGLSLFVLWWAIAPLLAKVFNETQTSLATSIWWASVAVLFLGSVAYNFWQHASIPQIAIAVGLQAYTMICVAYYGTGIVMHRF